MSDCSNAFSTIDRQIQRRLAVWAKLAQEALTGSKAPPLAVPGHLRSALAAHVQVLVGRTGRLFMDNVGAITRNAYREQIDRIHAMADRCHGAWATSVLRADAGLAARTQAVAAALMSAGPSDARISSRELGARLRTLDRELADRDLPGGANDWYLRRRAFQTREEWSSAGYAVSIRSLIDTGRLSPVADRVPTLYETRPATHEHSLATLAQYMPSDWIEQFRLVVAEVIAIPARELDPPGRDLPLPYRLPGPPPQT